MSTLKLTPTEALDLVREGRPFCEPNAGFMEQLEIYHQMGYTMELDDHPVYQRWLYKMDVESSALAGRAPERVHFRDAERRVVEIAMEGADGDKGNIELRCKKCR